MLSTAYKVKLLRRFMKKVFINENGCWEWLGSSSANQGGERYGYVRIDGLVQGAHRVSYILRYGEFDSALNVNHKCHNSICVNPEHLYVGTQRENLRDASDRKKQRVG